ncbi:beta-amyrin synthase [Artemisia annua]|uniref:Beta-amyrin synthase n=1 Tax=Artemisia annua TaxID=35608 RepID=A0A2U1KKI4_ARTAN|nr:beta-amyrin synthase [Artemisia annua]
MMSFGSQEWDVGLAIQALLATDLTDQIGSTLMKGHEFIKASQVKYNPSDDFKSMHRHISKGSFTFSDQDHGWQVSDCVAEVLNCCLLFATMPSEIVGEKMKPVQLNDVVKVILSLQQRKTSPGLLLPYQRSDLEGIFRETDGLPVMTRLLDPLLEILFISSFIDLPSLVCQETSDWNSMSSDDTGGQVCHQCRRFYTQHAYMIPLGVGCVPVLIALVAREAGHTSSMLHTDDLKRFL